MENIKKIISWPVILGIQVITTVVLLFFIFKLNILPTTYAVMVGMIFVLLGFINYAFVNQDGVDQFTFPEGVSDTQLYKQFGNSVSIPVIESIATYMYNVLENKSELR